MTPRHFWCLYAWFLVFPFAHAVPPELPFTISSPDFGQGSPLPLKCAYHQDNIAPVLTVKDVPNGTRSLVLIVDDPDAPSGLWTHWLVWNLPPDTTSIVEGKLPAGAVEGKNSFGHTRYDGPAPPSGTHRYFFRLYALQTMLSLKAGSDRATLDTALQFHYRIERETFGTYSAP